ncbi:MAG: glycosyltransferase family 2 protein [Acidobacteriota bacterium]|nr:glycosyltransferase family 2 protein [Acidobacteriota bacterium]
MSSTIERKTYNQLNENAFVAASSSLRVSQSPKVSVIIPAYKIADFIVDALRSVFSQTFTDFEVVVVNDGSPDTDEFERVIEPFRDRIVYIRQENRGAAAARNTAIRAARGEIIAFLDGDDFWLPEFLASQVEFLEKNNFDLVYADAEFFGEDVPAGNTYMQFSKSNGAVTTESLISWDCNVITSGTIARREAIVSAGLFDESPIFRRGQDFEMWFRLAKRGAKLGFQRRVLVKYRVRSGSLTGNHVEQAERNVTALEGIKAKFELTEAEKAAWERQMKIASAMLNVEKGKAEILKGEFDAARKSFAAANRFYRKPKLFLIGLMLKFAPRLLQRFFMGRAEHLSRNQANVI